MGVPIFLFSDTKFVDNYDELWDGVGETSIEAFLNVTELDTQINDCCNVVWTGTNSLGVSDGKPLGS